MSDQEESTAANEGRRTPLYDRHVQLGARMIPFAGWIMPVQYTGIIDEHRQVRSAAGMFDLGHMGQVDVTGPDALAFLQAVTTNDVAKLVPGQAQYSLLPNERGGVIDDILVYRRPSGNDYMVVINAANIAKDVGWLQQQREARPGLDVNVRNISDELGMIAVQGPKALDIVQRLTDIELSEIPYYSWREGTVAGVPAMIARTGYTGEDGVELYPPVERAGEVWDAVMAAAKGDELKPIGLGARDTLRLEARMPLYGNELADDISPLEAGLSWAVALDKGDFIGREAIAAMKERGAPRRTVGFRMTERSGTPRAHYPVQVDGREVGYVTSGAFSPTLNEQIGLALIERGSAKVGNPLDVIIRGKPVHAVQIKMPFYKRPQSGS